MTTVTDDFNRANQAPIAGNWTNGTAAGEATVSLTSNTVVVATAGSDSCTFYNGATFGNDQSSKAKVTVSGTGGGGAGNGVSVRRLSAATATFYRVVADHAASNNVAIQRFVGGASTSLSTFTQAFTDGDDWEIRAQGPQAATVVTVLYKGTVVKQVTDNSTVASGSPGLAYSSTETSASWDDWTGTDVFGVPPPPPCRSPFGM